MDRRPVLVAGGGIGGLSVTLTMHQIGVPCVVLESVRHFGAMVDERGMLRRELADDGLHPNETGDDVMVPLVEKAIATATERDLAKLGNNLEQLRPNTLGKTG